MIHLTTLISGLKNTFSNSNQWIFQDLRITSNSSLWNLILIYIRSPWNLEYWASVSKVKLSLHPSKFNTVIVKLYLSWLPIAKPNMIIKHRFTLKQFGSDSSIPVLNFLVYTIPSPDNTSDSMSTSINKNKNFFWNNFILLWSFEIRKEDSKIRIWFYRI